jgi:magnesium transporter
MSIVALSEMLGAPVRDASGTVRGRVREIAIAPQDHPTRIAFLIVKTSEGERLVSGDALTACGATVHTSTESSAWDREPLSDGLLLLKRDLLDQQIIDVHGHKVVRVNDVEIDCAPYDSRVALKVLAVDVGARGAIRRLGKGLVPSFTLRALLEKIPPRVIPWQYVDLLETDPARRVKLKIAYEGLSRLHPADIADIVEDLPPAERESVFETIDEEVAAEALEEIDPDIQVSRSIPTSRCPSSSRSTATVRPTSWKKWIPTRPPTCSAICPRIGQARSCSRWSPRSAARSRSCWSSASTPRRDA